MIGFPGLNKDDIWVNGSSDERWVVETIQVAAALRGVPIVYQVRMGLMPFSNTIYAVEVGGEPAVRSGPTLPMAGCGIVPVDHDYGGLDELAYVLASGCGIAGADVHIFTKAAFDANGVNIPRNLAVGATTTRVNGRWSRSIKLNPGDYVILFEKTGEYGPDTKAVTVVEPEQPGPALPNTPFTLGDNALETAPALPAPPPQPTNTRAAAIDQDEEFWRI